jgi:hypothetical protein
MPLPVVTGGATRHHILPTVPTTPGKRENVVPGEELSAPQLTPVPTTVLAGVVVPGKEEGVGDLATETARYMDESNEAYDQGKGDLGSFRTKSPFIVHLDELGLLIEDQPNRPPDRNDGQWLIGSV